MDLSRANSQDARIRYETGDACALALDDSSFDRCVSRLVLNFIPDARRALEDLVRVTRSGGTIAAAVRDVHRALVAFRIFWDTVSVVDAGALELRNHYYSARLTRPGELASAFTAAGFQHLEQDSVTVRMAFDSFADIRTPLLGKTGPVGAYPDSVDSCIRTSSSAGFAPPKSWARATDHAPLPLPRGSAKGRCRLEAAPRGKPPPIGLLTRNFPLCEPAHVLSSVSVQVAWRILAPVRGGKSIPLPRNHSGKWPFKEAIDGHQEQKREARA